MENFKYLHILSKDKFVIPYIRLVKKHFSVAQHSFFTFGKKNTHTQECSEIKHCQTPFDYIELYKKCKKAEKIFAHGIFAGEFIIFFFLYPQFIRKIYWIMWGRDLRPEVPAKKNIAGRLFFLIRNSVLVKIKHTITNFEPDAHYFKKCYNRNSVNTYCFVYPSNVFDSSRYKSCKTIDKKPIHIMVGHSATYRAKQIEIFNKIAHVNNELPASIFCPLSYGNDEHRDRVIKKGEAFFGKNFIPLTKFMDYQKYLNFLYNIDIAFFMHENQHAFGNLVQLLGLGKKIYMTDNSEQKVYFKSKGLHIEDYNDINFQPLSDDIKLQNIEIISNMHSESRLVSDWNNILSSRNEPNEIN